MLKIHGLWFVCALSQGDCGFGSAFSGLLHGCVRVLPGTTYHLLFLIECSFKKKFSDAHGLIATPHMPTCAKAEFFRWRLSEIHCI
ncbi:MAG: hypothetical protein P1V13_11430 [Rhizobiaceae bacterium]|nr:hypothetical protein [Rhizobiaceae bacterium]